MSSLLHFNGLYGQDGHEYLRQSEAVFDQWTHGSIAQSSLSDQEFAKGYPWAGALLRLLLCDPIWSLQVVSWISYALAAWLLDRILTLLSHGSRSDSRWVFVGLGLVCAPVFFRSGLTVMSDALGVALVLAAVFFSLRWIENERASDTVWAAACMALAVGVRVGLAGLMIPLALATGWFLMERRQWLWMSAALLVGVLLSTPHFLIERSVIQQPFQHSMLQHWSLTNFFQRSFINENGHVQYWLPNALYLLYPLAHPGFCLILPGLFLLVKKTDIALPAKKTLLFCLAIYLFLLGGLPHQNLRFLLPAYALVLLLIFPAWDRMYCYGFYFFKRVTWAVLGVTFFLQLFCTARIMAPTIARNRLETAIAWKLRQVLPPDAILFGFDVDIALRSYLSGVRFLSLWERRYEDFPAGSYIIFNEPALSRQWEGQNPMLNWTYARTQYELKTISMLPEGWVLYQVVR